MQTRKIRRFVRRESIYGLLIAGVALATLFFLLPSVLTFTGVRAPQSPFPVTVDPKNKTIKESFGVELLLQPKPAAIEAAAGAAGDVLHWLAVAVGGTQLYQSFAAVSGAPQVVTVQPGWRKEQVGALFAKTLGWSAQTQKMFLSLPPVSSAALQEGTIAPGDYAVPLGTSVGEVQSMVQEEFEETVLSRYTPAIQKVVPLSQGLTIASIIERETSDPEEMRIISGIIWNRIFEGMKLQMDSTLQYAKATGRGTWWPQVHPRDKYIDSPYNTYKNEGLPPSPISEPSVSAVLAALNPKKTSCLYYFHNDNGDFHCSETYEAHVAMLKKFYGRGR